MTWDEKMKNNDRNSIGRFDPALVTSLLEKEMEKYQCDRPRGRKLATEATRNFLWGVPMYSMKYTPGGIPMFIAEASGSRVVDVDGHEYVDVGLGDTAAFSGHAPPPVVEGLNEKIKQGFTTMALSEDAVWVGQELERRFGMNYWQFGVSATDANRCAIRLAQAVTKRPKVLIINRDYYGTIDETLAVLDDDGKVIADPCVVGVSPYPKELTTRVVEYNDLEALERELAHKDVAVMMMEGAFTNYGIIPAEPGYRKGVRELTRKYGTLLLIDETQSICAGPGGVTMREGLDPDIFTMGKPIAAGLGCGIYGFNNDLGQRVMDAVAEDTKGERYVSGFQGTLAGNPLVMAAIRLNLAHVLTEENFERMIAICSKCHEITLETIQRHGLPWHATQLGAASELAFLPEPPRNGTEAIPAFDRNLEDYLRLSLMNDGIMTSPMHMIRTLISPYTPDDFPDRWRIAFNRAIDRLVP